MRRLIVSEAARFPDLAQSYYEQAPRRGLDAVAAGLAQLGERDRLRIADPLRAANHFAYLVLGPLIDRAMFFPHESVDSGDDATVCRCRRARLSRRLPRRTRAERRSVSKNFSIGGPQSPRVVSVPLGGLPRRGDDQDSGSTRGERHYRTYTPDPATSGCRCLISGHRRHFPEGMCQDIGDTEWRRFSCGQGPVSDRDAPQDRATHWRVGQGAWGEPGLALQAARGATAWKAEAGPTRARGGPSRARRASPISMKTRSSGSERS